MKDIDSIREDETEPFDPAEYIRDPDEAALYLNDAISSADPVVVAAAIDTVVRGLGRG